MHPLITMSILWNTCPNNFQIQWKAIQEQKKKDLKEVRNITKLVTIVKWLETYHSNAAQMIGVYDTLVKCYPDKNTTTTTETPEFLKENQN